MVLVESVYYREPVCCIIDDNGLVFASCNEFRPIVGKLHIPNLIRMPR